MEARRELIEALGERYRRSERVEKKRILDEFVELEQGPYWSASPRWPDSLCRNAHLAVDRMDTGLFGSARKSFELELGDHRPKMQRYQTRTGSGREIMQLEKT